MVVFAMKMIIATFLAALILSGAMLTSISEDTLQNEIIDISDAVSCGEQTISFQFSPPTLSSVDGLTFVAVPEATQYITVPGAPQLPYATRTLVFPAGTVIENVEVSHTEGQNILLLGDIAPAEDPIPLNQTMHLRTEPDANIYTVPTFPDESVQYHTGMGLHKGRHVLFLSVQTFPVSYMPMEDQISYIGEFTITLRYTLTEEQIFVNDVYDFLVITPQEFCDALQPLVMHKKQYGVTTKLVTLSDIYNGVYFTVEGRDESEQCKYFIKNAVEEWGVTYVLLVGNPEYTPCRRVLSFAWGDHEQYSDHYYADLYAADLSFCTWDSNQNNQFGEVYDAEDFVDLYADVYVGRLACNGLEEVSTVVDKIITYESSTDNEAWFNKIILLGGDTFPGWGPYEGELVNEYVTNVMPEFSHISIQMAEGNFLPHRINQIWSQGAGFVCYSGHGFEYGFGTYPHDSSWMIAYYTPYLLGMSNGDMLPIVFFDACLTSKLGYRMLGNEDVACFAWCLVKKPDGGAIATIGATETAITSVDEYGVHGQASYLNLHFFMAYESGINLADMLVSAQNDYLNDIARGTADDQLYKMTIEQFILLGDPILKIGGYD